MVKKNSNILSIGRNWQLTAMIAPAIIFFGIFSYIPMAGLVLAFENFKNDKGLLSPFVGLYNFRFFFSTGDAFNVTKNNILYNLFFIGVGLVLQIACAIALSEIAGKWFKKITQSIMFMPYFISWVVAGAFVYNMFNYEYGAVNTFLKSIGVTSVDIFSNTALWPFIIVFFQAWKTVGYGTIIYLAAITGIDQEMYEAADIDGANIYRKILHITLPMLKPTAIILVLLALGNVIRGDFNMFYNLTGNSPLLYAKTDIIETYVYRALANSGDIGMAAAAGFYQSVLGFIIIMTVNTIIRKINPEYALF